VKRTGDLGGHIFESIGKNTIPFSGKWYLTVEKVWVNPASGEDVGEKGFVGAVLVLSRFGRRESGPFTIFGGRGRRGKKIIRVGRGGSRAATG